MARIDLTSDFKLKKPRGLIWTFKCDFNREICAKLGHCSDLRRAVTRQCSGHLPGSVLRAGYLKLTFSVFEMSEIPLFCAYYRQYYTLRTHIGVDNFAKSEHCSTKSEFCASYNDFGQFLLVLKPENVNFGYR